VLQGSERAIHALPGRADHGGDQILRKGQINPHTPVALTAVCVGEIAQEFVNAIPDPECQDSGKAALDLGNTASHQPLGPGPGFRIPYHSWQELRRGDRQDARPHERAYVRLRGPLPAGPGAQVDADGDDVTRPEDLRDCPPAGWSHP
jgi:hypothetical protein